jgi:hypothetical protein
MDIKLARTEDGRIRAGMEVALLSVPILSTPFLTIEAVRVSRTAFSLDEGVSGASQLLTLSLCAEAFPIPDESNFLRSRSKSILRVRGDPIVSQ